jgi:hypothetical protein
MYEYIINFVLIAVSYSVSTSIPIPWVLNWILLSFLKRDSYNQKHFSNDLYSRMIFLDVNNVLKSDLTQ